MSSYLLFRLYAPLASWGDVAIGYHRPSFAHPSKSAILGLIGAALGVRREDESDLEALHGGYGFAVRVDSPGSLLIDYHTAQVPPEKALKARPAPRMRREELSVPRGDLTTVLSLREYRADAAAVACVWPSEEKPRWALDELAGALRRPRFTIYLGRKSCPPALPLCPLLVSAGDPVEAMRGVTFPDGEWLTYVQMGQRRTFHWEGEAPSVTGVQVTQRRDAPRSRVRWQFANRVEHMMVEEKDSDVPEQD